MQAQDLPAVLAIQAECFDAATRESQASFAAKLAASPSTCFVAQQEGRAVGYLVAVPAASAQPPRLNGAQCALPTQPTACTCTTCRSHAGRAAAAWRRC